MKRYNVYESAIGPLFLAVNDEGSLVNLWFLSSADDERTVAGPSDVHDPSATLEVEKQLAEYFSGKRNYFDLQLAPNGTEFQKKVWDALLTIPYGQTRSYGQIATQIGNPAACRAVGLANGSNPIAVVIPCHRVIGSNGKLTGFGGGLPLKERLLRLESGGATLDL